jgi:hypothetical protein
MSRRLGLDRAELAILAALSGLSVLVLAALLTKGRAITGADGLLASDQLQYFTWIRQAAEHGLIGNEYDMAPDQRVFLHPGFLLSGLVHAVTGLPVPASYLLWKPVAVGLLFYGALRYVRRLLPTGRARHAALLLALLAVMPASAFLAWTGFGGDPRQYTFDFISGELASSQYLWGYLMTAIAVALMPLVLLAVERGRTDTRRGPIALAAMGALLVTWLQPWQGGTLLLVVLVAELACWRRSGRRPPARTSLVFAAGTAPALYYAILERTDPAWELAGQVNAAGNQATWSWPWWAIVLTLLPLALPAALAYRIRPAGWQEIAVRAWPLAALAVYLAPVGTFPYHAFQGMTIPLAVLAVEGALSLERRPSLALVAAYVVLLTVPGTIHKFTVAVNSVRAAGDPYFVFPGEQQALDALERDPRPGGVLAPAYAGHMIPYRTGREVYVGALSWTPDWDARVTATRELFEEDMPPAEAQELARRSGARFVFVDCRPGLRDLRPVLGPMVERVRAFGCATLYELRG